MAPKRPLYMQAGGGDSALSYSAADYRQMLASLVSGEGVLWGMAVTQRSAGANFSVDVAAGANAIVGDDVSNQGTYLCVNDGVYNVPVPSPPGSGTRIHRLVAQVRDKLHLGSWTTYDWDVLLLEDTGSGTPAVPASAIPLARISVSAGQVSVQDSHITDDRVNALLRPARPQLVGADADRPDNPLAFERIGRTDKGYEELWTGSAWAALPNSAAGPQWGTWTPALTATTVNPTLGTGSAAVGYYVRNGRTIHATAFLRAGTSGVAAGTGNYRVSLPVTARDISPVFFQGAASGFDNSGSDVLSGTARCGSVSGWGAVEIYLDSTTLSSTGPFVLAANDSFGFSISYEAAS